MGQHRESGGSSQAPGALGFRASDRHWKCPPNNRFYLGGARALMINQIPSNSLDDRAYSRDLHQHAGQVSSGVKVASRCSRGQKWLASACACSSSLS